MLKSLSHFFRPPVYPGNEEKTRAARNTNTTILILLAIVTPFQILYLIDSAKNGVGSLTFTPLILFALISTAWIFLKSERITLAGTTLVGTLWLIFNGLAAFKYGIKDSTFIANIPLCLLASFLIGWRAGAALSALSVLSGFVIAYLETAGSINPPIYPATNFALGISGIIIISAGLTYLLVTNLQDSLKRAQENTLSLEKINTQLGQAQGTLRERTDQLTALNDVGSAATAILDTDELISKVANLITERFGYYYTAIFIVSPDGQWAELRNATGEAGRVLKESRHRLEVGGKSMVGSAISFREPRVALDVGAEPVRFNNPLLPYTRSEIALPLIAGDHVLGALDVQSTKHGVFGIQEIETLESMARQLAIALENARLYQEATRSLQEIQTVQRQYIKESWSLLPSVQPMQYDLGEDLTTTLESSLTIPLTLRNEVIGEITLDADTDWSSEEKAWADSIATQAAIALENARLLESSKKSAAAEKIIAEITGKIWSSNTIEGILQTAVREIGKTFNAAEVTLELDPEEYGKNQ